MCYNQNFGTLVKPTHMSRWRWHNIPIQHGRFKISTDSIDTFHIPATEMEEMRLRNANLYMKFMKEQHVVTQSADDVRKPHRKKTSPSSPNYSSTLCNPLAYTADGKIDYGNFRNVDQFILEMNKYLHLEVHNQKVIKLIFQALDKKIVLNLGIDLNPGMMLSEENLDERMLFHQIIPAKFDNIVGRTRSLLEMLEQIDNCKKIDEYLNPVNHLLVIDHGAAGNNNNMTFLSALNRMPRTTTLCRLVKKETNNTRYSFFPYP